MYTSDPITRLGLGGNMTREQWRALEILDHSGQHGATEAFMLADGFGGERLPGDGRR